MVTIALKDIRLTIEQQQLIADNIKLVDFVANKLREYIGLDGIEYEDLQAIGRVGLIRAVARFDSSQATAFSSLAIPFIKGEITHYIRDRTSAIKSPRGAERLKIDSLDRVIPNGQTLTQLIDTITYQEKLYQPKIDDDLLGAIETLSREDRDILVMTHVNGCDRKTTAEWLETYPQHITRRIRFAIDRIEVILADPNLKLAKPKRRRNALPFVVDGVVNYPAKYRCVVCNNIFGLDTTHTTQLAQTCSSQCARSLAASKTPARSQLWTRRELDFCARLVGKRNLEDIHSDLTAYSQSNNLPTRTKQAVKIQMGRLYKSVIVNDGDLSARELARQLDIPVDRIRVWIENGLKSDRTSSGRYKITCDDLVKFAKANHYRFYGIDSDKLAKFIADPNVLKKCIKAQPHINRIEVVRTDNNKKYRSLSAAARATGISKNHILTSGWIKPSEYITESGRSKEHPIDLSLLKDKTKLLDPKTRHKKRWMFTSPDGIRFETNNLALFARVHQLSRSLLSAVWEGRNQSHAGWSKAVN